jgi:cell division protein FtsQ
MADKKQIGKWLLTTVWVLIAAGTVVLLVAANNKGKQQLCTGMEVTIQGVSRHCFLDKNDILLAINEYLEGGPKGQPVSSFNLLAMESELRKNVWVRKIEMYFDNNNMLQVNVHEREPVARVFTTTGGSFYVDSAHMMLPLSQKYSARLPVFTNFPTDRRVLTPADSSLLGDIVAIGQAVRNDDFRMAFIEQIDITSVRDFELVPKIGNGLVRLGTVENLEEKFSKLLLFFRKVVIGGQAWNRYSTIDLRFRDQVVAQRRDAADVVADSAAVKAIRQTIEAYARKLANDTLQSLMRENEHTQENIPVLLESFERDDEDPAEAGTAVPSILPILKPAANANNNSLKTAKTPTKTLDPGPRAKSVPYPMKKTGLASAPVSSAAKNKTKPAAQPANNLKKKTAAAGSGNDYR